MDYYKRFAIVEVGGADASPEFRIAVEWGDVDAGQYMVLGEVFTQHDLWVKGRQIDLLKRLMPYEGYSKGQIEHILSSSYLNVRVTCPEGEGTIVDYNPYRVAAYLVEYGEGNLMWFRRDALQIHNNNNNKHEG